MSRGNEKGHNDALETQLTGIEFQNFFHQTKLSNNENLHLLFLGYFWTFLYDTSKFQQLERISTCIKQVFPLKFDH